MVVRGRLKDIGRVISFEVARPDGIERYEGKDLDITIKTHREKRSKDANAYYWCLVRELAQALGLSETATHNIEMSRYGQWDILPDGSLNRAIKPPTWDWRESVTEHYRFAEMYVDIGEELWPMYWVIRGSHTYNTKEMSILINGIVEDAKEQGIEVLTPDEIQRMIASYDEALKRKQISQHKDES